MEDKFFADEQIVDIEYCSKEVRVILWNQDDDERVVVFSGVPAVCGRCRGEGTHTNPSIDGNGLPPEYLDDDEFMEGYMSGVYDVTCHECKGNKIVYELPKLSDGDEKKIQYHYEEEWYSQQERAAEIAAGC